MQSALSWGALCERWQRWLFVRGELRNLALFRMGWALAMFMAARTEAELPALYSSAQYHLPIAPWFTPLAAPALARLILIGELGAALTLVGLWPRFGAALVLGALGYLFALDLLLFRNHVYLGLLLGGLLCASPAGRVLSLDALVRRLLKRRVETRGSLIAAQLIKAQVLIVYGYSVLNKLRRSFLDGFTLQQELPYALRSSLARGFFHDGHGRLLPAWERAIHDDRVMSACACAVVAAEAFLCIGLPMRRLRRYAIATGLLLHGSIFLLMDIRVFGLLMVSSYLLFLEPAPELKSAAAQATA